MANEIKTLYSDSAKTNAIYPRTKQNAISDADGNTMGNVGFLNATELVSGANPVSLGIDMTLLWTNPSPTSTFANQTISLNLTDYDLLVITIKGETDDPNGYTTNIAIKGNNNILYACRNSLTANIGRKAIFDNNGITFTILTGAEFAIPYQIYGIKGVINNG